MTAGQLPFLLLFLSFLLTFVATRSITRMIRAGIGRRQLCAGGRGGVDDAVDAAVESRRRVGRPGVTATGDATNAGHYCLKRSGKFDKYHNQMAG